MRTLRHAEVDSVGTHRCGCSAVCACAVELYELALVGRVRGRGRFVESLLDKHSKASGIDRELYGQEVSERSWGTTFGDYMRTNLEALWSNSELSKPEALRRSNESGSMM